MNIKHANTVYVPCLSRKTPSRQYYYGNKILKGVGTDFLKFLGALDQGKIYYDPGIKLEYASSDSPKVKRRNQFRIKNEHLESLYDSFDVVELPAGKHLHV